MKKIEENPLQHIFSIDISSYTSIREFQPDDIITKDDEKPLYLFYMFEGRAKLFLSHENGKISLINFIEAPCFIGEMELLDDSKKAQLVKAISKCRCYQILLSECRQQILQDIKFLRYLCKFLSNKAIQNTNNYMRNQSYPLRVRLASFILKMSINDYYREPHTEVAEFLGVTYRHLLYVLEQFVKEGILEKTTQGYHLVNTKRLLECTYTSIMHEN